jgi:hypothetical protein
MVILSIAYSRMQAYRQMRAERQPDWDKQLSAIHVELAQEALKRRLKTEDLLPEADWYVTMIHRERSLYGPLNRTRSRNRYRPPARRPADLQDAFDRERTGVFAVQILFLVVIACLVLARLT